MHIKSKKNWLIKYEISNKSDCQGSLVERDVPR